MESCCFRDFERFLATFGFHFGSREKEPLLGGGGAAHWGLIDEMRGDFVSIAAS